MATSFYLGNVDQFDVESRPKVTCVCTASRSVSEDSLRFFAHCFQGSFFKHCCKTHTYIFIRIHRYISVCVCVFFEEFGLVFARVFRDYVSRFDLQCRVFISSSSVWLLLFLGRGSWSENN